MTLEALLAFARAVHPLVPAVLLRMAGLNALDSNAEPQSPDRRHLTPQGVPGNSVSRLFSMTYRATRSLFDVRASRACLITNDRASMSRAPPARRSASRINGQSAAHRIRMMPGDKKDQ